MLPKSERLTKNDFESIRPKVFFRGEFFDVALVPLEATKFACVISKKKIKRAVDRNKVKRRIFGALKESRPKSTGHFIFYIKSSAENALYGSLNKEISKAFATLH